MPYERIVKAAQPSRWQKVYFNKGNNLVWCKFRYLRLWLLITVQIIDTVNSKARTPITDPYRASLLTLVSSVRNWAVKNAFPLKKKAPKFYPQRENFRFLVGIFTHYIPQTLEILKTFAMPQHQNSSVALIHVLSKVYKFIKTRPNINKSNPRLKSWRLCSLQTTFSSFTFHQTEEKLVN